MLQLRKKELKKPLKSKAVDSLRVTTIQSELHWERIGDNLAHFDRHLSKINHPTDLVLLPEMFSTGFSMNAEALAEKMNGPSLDWMRRKAAELDAVVAGSLIVKEEGKYYNRLIWMQADGSYLHYDKRHLFTLAKEHQTYTAGQERLLATLKGWRICPLICYDLRFPVWSRNSADFDLLIYVANWPVPRSMHWKSLLQARAIENQCYCIGVNRVGIDGNGMNYSGDTSVFDYAGKLLYQSSQVEQVATVRISRDEQLRFRSKLNFLPDQDSFIIQ